MLAWQQFRDASNMTDEIAALAQLCQTDTEERKMAIRDFYAKWQTQTLVMNKWLAVQAGSKLKNTLGEVMDLEKCPAYDPKNPNKIRSLVGVFAHNLPRFHDVSGAGYRYVADKILEIDAFNPHVAGRLATAFRQYGKLDETRRGLAQAELERILGDKKLSPNVYEIISKTVGHSKTTR